MSLDVLDQVIGEFDEDSEPSQRSSPRSYSEHRRRRQRDASPASASDSRRRRRPGSSRSQSEQSRGGGGGSPAEEKIRPLLKGGSRLSINDQIDHIFRQSNNFRFDLATRRVGRGAYTGIFI